MMRKISLLSLLCVCSAAYAAQPNNPVYFDFNVGYLSAPVTARTTGSVAENVTFGYLFNPYFALETGLTGSVINVNQYTVGRYVYSPTAYYLSSSLAVKGILPLGDVFNLYGKFGVSYNDYSYNNAGYTDTLTSAGVLLGVGAMFNISKQWALHVEDNYTILANNNTTGKGLYSLTEQINNPNVLMVGAEFKF